MSLFKRSVFSRLFGGLLLVAMLAACTPIADKKAPAPAVDTKQAASGQSGNQAQPKQPKRGGTLVMAQGGDIVSPNPWPSGITRHSVLRALYSTPWRLDKERKPQPDLAASWEISPDKKELTLKLRKGVKFHNGRELTAEDLVWTLEWTRDAKTNSQIAPMLKDAKATVVDPFTVRLAWPEPANHMLDTINEFFVVAKESLPQIDRKPIGTGPFKIVEYVPGQVLKMARNEQYFVPDLPYLDGVEIQMLPDAQSMIVALESGTVSMVRQPPSQELERLKKAGYLVQYSLAASNTLAYVFDVNQKPFTDPRVRQAINFAIDRDRIVDSALFGIGKSSCMPWPKLGLAYDEELDRACKFDLEKAKTLLQEAGVKDLSFNLVVSTASWPEHTRIAQILQSDLGKIGVKVNIRDIEAAQWSSTIQVGKFPADVPMAAFLYGKANLDPMMLFTTLPFRVKGGATHFEDPEYTRLVAASGLEMDQEKRKQLYKQVSTLLRDKAFVLPVSPLVRQWALQSYVKGYDYDANDRELFMNVWLDK